MGSSGDSGSGYGMAQLMGQGTPMPGLPIAGKDSTIGDPYNYGKYQNFLPDIKAEGPNDNATGLRPEMFEYRGPNNPVRGNPAPTPASASASGGFNNGDLEALRNQLAQLQAGISMQQRPAEAQQQGYGGGFGGGAGDGASY